ncbi:MAG: hypothetical protein JWN99_119 [Ilumatobacteraceae bacterium]|nr:hypothetical protein [Ilumatobacteraceae bacterium]
MARRTWTGIAVAVLAFGLLMFVASSGDVQVFHDPPPSRSSERPPAQVAENPETTQQPVKPAPIDVPDNRVVAGIVTVLLVVIAVMILHAVATTWFRRLRLRGRRPPDPPDDVVVLPEVAPPDIVLDREAQLQALAHGTPRNAIVACWLRVEEDVASAGWPRHVAETSAEFTSRVLASSSLDAVPVNQLAALYREARFSQHPMDQPDRDLALTALRQIHAALAARADATALPTTAGADR